MRAVRRAALLLGTLALAGCKRPSHGHASATPAAAPAPEAPAPEAPAPEPAPAATPAPFVDRDDAVSDPPFPGGRTASYSDTCIVTVADPAAWPAKLSDTGCYASLATRTLATGALAYDVRLPFFSGGAAKQRALVLPSGGKITFATTGAWSVPTGTRAVKTFLLDDAPVETRILRRTEAGVDGASYRWTDDASDAVLQPDAPESAALHGLTWYFPSRQDCGKCHTPAAGFFLGLDTVQMNTRHDMAGLGHAYNQIETLTRLGYLDGAPATPWQELPRLADPTAAALPLEARARAWLHANCADCHQPGSTGNAQIDLRVGTPLASAGLCNAPDMQGDLGVPDATLLTPGRPEASVLWLRLATDNADLRMPPLGASTRDEAGPLVVKEWIQSLTGCP